MTLASYDMEKKVATYLSGSTVPGRNMKSTQTIEFALGRRTVTIHDHPMDPTIMVFKLVK